ncbi:protein-disulfide reductase DsbD domain-containing protein [Seonamhaeicola aphaedonensis]|uniref:Thiol:disulfide interchange protein DsbD n=1 Tax=Seonamhaeicola aphaedonensis TaxID=1461338 RepID=A0A3D9H3U4_9FLAO|nr:protein-disulfide reductase DsbD domain-containing protein [Seonamhaeicola aphaedonensis]RED44159.1 thiol:disulfide interchange protein DsbD [Seonamhaeicola aphaedonensis]
MKNIFALLFLLTTVSHSQSNNPISWTTNTDKISDKEYDLIIVATLEPSYHLYSQTVPNNGPIPTVFNFKKSKNYKLIGNVKEPIGQTTFDPVFGMEIKFFDDTAIFKQRIKIIGKKRFKIIGEITFMTCNDKNCIRGTKTIEFIIRKL